MKTIFKGTGVAMITPFNKNYEVDYIALERHINFLIENKVDYIVLMGTTSEAVCLNETEKNEITEFSKRIINHRVPIMYGMGGNNTHELIEKIQKFNYKNIDGILSVAPYYNKPNQEGLYQHFKEISKCSPVEVIMYNVPGRTSVNILPETILRISKDFSNISSVKEASGNIDNIMQIINDKPEDFTVLSGDDAITLPLISVGAEGVISVSANAFPKETSQMTNFALKHKITEAQKIHYKLLKAVNLMFAEGNPTGVKCFLSQLNKIDNYLRLPLISASKILENNIKNYLQNFDYSISNN